MPKKKKTKGKQDQQEQERRKMRDNHISPRDPRGNP